MVLCPAASAAPWYWRSQAVHVMLQVVLLDASLGCIRMRAVHAHHPPPPGLLMNGAASHAMTDCADWGLATHLRSAADSVKHCYSVTSSPSSAAATPASAAVPQAVVWHGC
jgi:hypothetical protein